MIDLHTHTLLSDGVLLPTELARRAKAIGYSVIGITDHADSSNIELIIDSMKKVCRDVGSKMGIRIIPGVELTHVPPALIPQMADKARKLGSKLIVVHGETIVEPVKEGTNRAALESDIDILAHPGLITEAEARIAAKKNICLEITTRQGHCLTNGHVAKVALKTKAPLVLNTDSHTPGDLVARGFAEMTAAGAGLPKGYHKVMLKNSGKIIQKV
ncbi:histidinol phosphate phosphatase domain-containing protein [Candidatus Auribacterota bacterium]